MPRCIYCLRDGSSTTFTAREHVIPASLGSFAPLNPTLTAEDGLVCDVCNTQVFSPLETIFREDTLEGIQGQRLNIQNQRSVTMRDNHFKIERLSGFGDDFFDQMFFFLKPQDGVIVPDLRNQIKLRRFQGGYRVFDPDALDVIQEGSSRFRRMSADLQNLNQKDMAIFGETQEDIDRMIAVLHRFGVDYKEKERRYRSLKPGEKLELHEDYSCTINTDLARVLAKIAFNYFAYCAKQEGREHILYTEPFNKIRNFALDGSGVTGLREIISSINEEPILLEEKEVGKRLIIHLINFRAEEGSIVSRMTFFGLPAIYKVEMGTLPEELSDERFGCGHAFDPFGHSVINLSQTRPPENPTAEQLRTTFGLLKRI